MTGSRLDRVVRRAMPHIWAGIGTLVLLATLPTLWVAAPLPAALATVFGLLPIAAGYLVRSGAAFNAEVELDHLRDRVEAKRRFDDLVSGQWPSLGDENDGPHGRHAPRP